MANLPQSSLADLLLWDNMLEDVHVHLCLCVMHWPPLLRYGAVVWGLHAVECGCYSSVRLRITAVAG